MFQSNDLGRHCGAENQAEGKKRGRSSVEDAWGSFSLFSSSLRLTQSTATLYAKLSVSQLTIGRRDGENESRQPDAAPAGGRENHLPVRVREHGDCGHCEGGTDSPGECLLLLQNKG